MHQITGVFFSGKATVIYPVCENNVYIISPKISNVLTPVIKERFAEKFPGENYVQMLSMFNSPFSISHRTHFHNPASVQLLGKVVVFFLQQHLIVQVNASHPYHHYSHFQCEHNTIKIYESLRCASTYVRTKGDTHKK